MATAPQTPHRKLAIAGALLGTVVSLVAIQALVGRPARLVELIGLFAAAFTAGASVVAAIRRRP